MRMQTPNPDQIKKQQAQTNDAPALSEQTSTTAAQSPDLSIGMVAGIVVLVFVMAALALRMVGGQTTSEASTAIPTMPPIPTPVKEIIVVTAAPLPTAIGTPTPSCLSGQAQLSLIEAMEHKSDWKQAAVTAEATLDLPALCDADRRVLIQKAVADGLNVLYYTAVDGQDRTGQQHAVDAYLALRQRAHDAHVEFPSPLQVATQAFQISQFRLAIIAVETAYAEHDFDPRVDRAATHLYVSALYSIGLYYTKAPQGSNLYTEGLAYLSASHRLAAQEQTGQGEAATLLTHLMGPDETVWPAPYQSPLLAH